MAWARRWRAGTIGCSTSASTGPSRLPTVSIAKPAPDLYRAAAAELGFEPDQAAVFDDCREGLEAGRIGHFGYLVGVEGLDGVSSLRGRGADVIVADVGDLLGAGERDIAAPGPL